MYSLIRTFLGKKRTRQVEVERKLTKIERTRAAVRRLGDVRSFDARIASTIPVQCTDANIISFIEQVEGFVAKLSRRENITPLDCFREQITTTLDHFFTDSEGMYIRQSALRVLVSQSDALLDSIEAAKKQDEDNGKYLERLMGKTFNSLLSIEEAIASAQPK